MRLDRWVKTSRLGLDWRWSIIVSFFLFPFVLQAQDIELKGTMKEYGANRKLAGVTITLIENGSQVKKAITSSNGKFDFDLKFDKSYKIVASKVGWVSKNITINTKDIPQEEKDRGGFMIPMELTLFEEVEDLDVSILDQPIGKFAYDTEMNDIIHDPAYTSQIQNQIKALMKEYERKKKEEALKEKEAERLAEEEAERLAKVQAEFDEYMDNGDAAVREETLDGYEEAVGWFEKAVALIPDDTEAQNALADAKKLFQEEKERVAGEEEAERLAKEKEAKYKELITEADKLFKGDDFENAKSKYTAASEVKPEERYPQDQLAEIERKLAEIAANEEALAEQKRQYDEKIKEADDLMGEKKYENAISSYEAASKILPDEDYPKTQIKEARRLWDAEKEEADRLARVEGEYQQLIAAADGDYDSKQYENAKNTYQKALELKPEEEHPRKRITEIEGILADLKAEEERLTQLQADYEAAVKDGDRLVKDEQYDDALTAYKKANELKPEEQYPQTKITEVEGILAQLEADADAAAELEAKYNDLIKKADGEFDLAKFENAIATYQEASELKGAEQYPKDRIKEAQGKLDELAKYDEFIKAGDDALAADDLSTAKTSYQKASDIQPSEQYPKDKMAEIDQILADRSAAEQAAAQLEADYQAAVKEGDRLFKEEDYPAAKTSFEKAAELKAEEQYPKDKITEIDGIIAQQEADAAAAAELEAKYNDLIKKADGEFDLAQFENAIATYQEASALNGAEQYPKDRIKEAQGKIDDLAKYDEFIKSGDDALAADDLSTAKTSYQKASDIQPNEQYPKDKMAEIDQMLADRSAAEQAAAQLEADYQAAVKEGDRLFKEEDYPAAKTSFEKAAELKAEEQYPKDKITEIDGIISQQEADAAAAAELEAKYNDLIKKADGEFDGEQFENAIATYEEASALKGAEQYPKDRIKEARTRLDDIAKYAEFIKSGDDALGADDLATAKTSYQKASDLKPNEQYPKDKMAEIDQMLADRSAAEQAAAQLEADYQAAVKEGDRLFKEKDYESSKAAFEQAVALKSEEQYPKDKITEIDGLLADAAAAEAAAAEVRAKYDELVKKADGSFDAGNYQDAIGTYEEASALIPEERYPKDRIEEARSKLGDIAQYDEFVKSGDNAFTARDYASAKAAFEKANEIKPEEQYPKDKLAEINQLLADLAAEQDAAAKLQADYDASMKAGDQAMSDKRYEDALSSYQQAAGYKPDETLPGKKIAEVQAILDELAANEENMAAINAEYEGLIKEADGLFGAESYADAIPVYEKASKVKPELAYPRDQIKACNVAISEGDRLAQEEADRIAREAREQEEADRLAQQEADRLAQEEADRIAREARDKEEADRLAALEADRLAQEEADRKRQEENERLARERAEESGDKYFGTRDNRSETEAERFMREALAKEEADKWARIQKIKKDKQDFDTDHTDEAGDERLMTVEEMLAAREKELERLDALGENRLEGVEEMRDFTDKHEGGMAEDYSVDHDELIKTQAELDELEAERWKKMTGEGESLRQGYVENIQEVAENNAQWIDDGYDEDHKELVESQEELDKFEEESYEALTTNGDNLRMEYVEDIQEKAENHADWIADASTTDYESLAATQAELDKFEEEALETLEENGTPMREGYIEDIRELAKNNGEWTAEGFENDHEKILKTKEDLVEFEENHLETLEENGTPMREGYIEDIRELAKNNGEWTAEGFENDHKIIIDTKEDLDKFAEAQEKVGDTGQEVREGSLEDIRDKQEVNENFLTEMGQNHTARREDNLKDIEGQYTDRRKQYEQYEDDRDGIYDGISQYKKDLDDTENERATTADAERKETQERLDKIEWAAPKSYDEFYLSKLAKDYPQGVSEESYTQPNKIIIRRVVVKGNKADDYQKVVAKFGVHYFKNGRSISEDIWNLETKG